MKKYLCIAYGIVGMAYCAARADLPIEHGKNQNRWAMDACALVANAATEKKTLYRLPPEEYVPWFNISNGYSDWYLYVSYIKNGWMIFEEDAQIDRVEIISGGPTAPINFIGNCSVSEKLGIGALPVTEKLEVTGNGLFTGSVLLGASGDVLPQLTAVGSSAVANRISCVAVAGDGTATDATNDVMAAHTDAGTYAITFSPAFSSVPIVAVTPMGATRAVVVSDLSVGGCTVQTQQLSIDFVNQAQSWTAIDTPFTVVAIGRN